MWSYPSVGGMAVGGTGRGGGWGQAARGLEQVTGLDQGRGQEVEMWSEWHVFWREKLSTC